MSALVVVALVVPLLFWLAWYRSERVVYNGKAVLQPFDDTVPRVRQDRAFVAALLPIGGYVLVEVSSARAKAIPAQGKEVELEIRARVFGRLHIEQVTWNPGEKPEKADQRFDGLFLAAYYLILGLFLMSGPHLFGAAAALILSGFVTGGVTRSDISYTGLPLVTKVFLAGWLVLSGVMTAFLFQKPSILVLFPGTLIAFTFGQLLGMYGLYRGQKERADRS